MGSGGGVAGAPHATSDSASGPEAPPASGGQYSARVSRHRRPAQIALQPWNPAAPYLKELRAARAKDAFAVYLKNRATFAHSPAFFLDCADYFFDRHDMELAIQVLSNLAELEPNDPAMLRLMGNRLIRAARYDLAIDTFEDLLRLRSDDPQSYRDLALALAQRADATRAAMKGRGKPSQTPRHDAARDDGKGAAGIRDDYARAVDLLTEVVMRRWNGFAVGIELPTLTELNCILARAKAYGVGPKGLDSRFIKLLDMDIRVVMTWHADNTAMGLMVTEPSGEKVGRDHDRTAIGGLVSHLSAGGPEEYLIRKAKNGEYTIQATYGGAADPPLPVTVQVDIFTNFGRDNEQHRSITVRLKEKTDSVTLGQVKF
jgi:hypothetical protein